MSLLDQVMALPVHSISGYEWECDECHYHMATWLNQERVPEMCRYCNTEITEENNGVYVDHKGDICDHGDLLDREQVLTLLGVPR